MSTLFMIRHGQASFGKENYDELSDLGRRQSRILGERLLNSDIRFDAVYSGTLLRQTDTAGLVLSAYGSQGIEVPDLQKLDAFNEYNSELVLRELIPLMVKEDNRFQKHVDRIFDDKRLFQNVFEKVMLKWVTGDFTLPELIRWEEFFRRVEQGIEHIMKTGGSGKNVALFTSGGPIAAAVCKALHLTNQDTIQVSWQVVNTSVSCFKFTDSRFMLSTFNEHSHLKKGLITYR